jgi:hypothetical protein
MPRVRVEHMIELASARLPIGDLRKHAHAGIVPCEN